MTSEPVTAVMVMERTSRLSIRNVWSSISTGLFNINKHAKVLIWNTDLIMLITSWQAYNIIVQLKLLENQYEVDNIIRFTLSHHCYMYTCTTWCAIHLSYPYSGLSSYKILKQHFCILILLYIHSSNSLLFIMCGLAVYRIAFNRHNHHETCIDRWTIRYKRG